MLRHVFRTENRLTLAVSGTGSAGMEAVLVNLIEPGDEVLVCVNGVFGNRMADIVERVGGSPAPHRPALGRGLRPGGDRADARPPSRESGWWPSSTPRPRPAPTSRSRRSASSAATAGACCSSTRHLARRHRARGRRLGHRRLLQRHPEVPLLPARPGAGDPVGPRAVEQAAPAQDQGRRAGISTSAMIASYWGEGERAYHHTAPISMNYALHEALALVLEEGLEPRFAAPPPQQPRADRRPRAPSASSRSAQQGHRLPMLNAVRLPAGVDEAPRPARGCSTTTTSRSAAGWATSPARSGASA